MELKEEDLRIEVWRKPSNFGGQTVGVTDCSVKITHIPTGLSVTWGEERSQLQNKAKAMTELEKVLAEKRPEVYAVLAENATTVYDEPTSIYTGPSTPVDITLGKRKYREAKPKGKFRSDYGGNSGRHITGGIPPTGIRRRPKKQMTKKGGFGHI